MHLSRWGGRPIHEAEVGDVGSYIQDFEVEARIRVSIAEGVAVAILAALGHQERWTNKEFICVGSVEERKAFLALHDGTWWLHSVRTVRITECPRCSGAGCEFCGKHR